MILSNREPLCCSGARQKSPGGFARPLNAEA